MRQPAQSLCALVMSFALGIASTLQVQSLRESLLTGDALLPALALPAEDDAACQCRAFVVTLDKSGRLNLNGAAQGTLDDTASLVANLSASLRAREAARNNCTGLTLEIPRASAVYVRAPRSLPYGDLTLALDAVERAGAKSIKLALEDDAEDF